MNGIRKILSVLIFFQFNGPLPLVNATVFATAHCYCFKHTIEQYSLHKWRKVSKGSKSWKTNTITYCVNEGAVKILNYVAKL